MFSADKLDKALAQIDNTRKQVYASQISAVIADMEQKIQENPFALVDCFESLDKIYAQAPKERQEVYAEIKNMLATAIAEHSTIILEDAKEIVTA